MNILALETATSATAVALRTEKGVDTAVVAPGANRHNESLGPAIDSMLREAGLAPRDIGRVVVDRGPGLYTGLRVGIATALGFALGANAELVGVTSLELLAHGARDHGVRGRLVSCVDGRRGEVFVQSFDLGESEFVARDDPAVLTLDEILSTWSRGPVEVTFTGDGAARYARELTEALPVTMFDQVVPPVHYALGLGATRSPEVSLVPLYLREADAVANFSTREQPS